MACPAACTKPTIAICCDLRIASAGSKFGVPAARLGVGYGSAGVKKPMDMVGPAFTKEISFIARHFDRDDGLAMGPIDRAVAAGALESFTRTYRTTIFDNAPLTIRTLKRTVSVCFDSQDFTEGRRPSWRSAGQC